MHLKPFKNFTYSVVFQNKQALRHEETKAMRSFEGSFRNLKFSPTTSILLNFFFQFIGIKCFFLKFKTTVPPRKTPVAQKHRGISRQEKTAFDSPLLGTSLPLPQSLYGRTLTSQPKFFGSIVYQEGVMNSPLGWFEVSGHRNVTT